MSTYRKWAHGLLAAIALSPYPVAATAPQERAGQEEPQARRDGLELGELGTIYPQPQDEVLGDVLVAQDRVGGATQALMALAGSPGGYAAVWRDTRDGNLGFYLGLLSSGGEPMRRELPVNRPLTSRQFEPTVAVEAGLKGAVAWFLTNQARSQPHIRFLDGRRGWSSSSGTIPLGANHRERKVPGEDGRGAVRRGEVSPGWSAHRPALAVSPDGEGMVAWIEGPEIFARRFQQEGGGWQSRGEAVVLNPQGPAAAGKVQLASSETGERLCAFGTAAGIGLWMSSADGSEARLAEGGAGEPIELIPAAGGGWWLLSRGTEGHVVRRLDAELEIVGEEIRPPVGASGTCDIAGWNGGLAVLTASGDGDEDPRTRLGPMGISLYSAEGALLNADPIDLPGPAGVDAWGGRVASGGPMAQKVLVAWTDSRGGSEDVYYRLLSLDYLLDRGEQRWNSDHASADQTNPQVGSNGTRAVLVWQDNRSGEPTPYGRVMGARGEFLTDEFQLGQVLEGAEARGGSSATGSGLRPSVAVAQGGQIFATWKHRQEGSQSLQGQLYTADGQALQSPRLVDAGHNSTGNWASAVIALAKRGGFVVAWVRDDGELYLRQLSLKGKAQGPGLLVAAVPGGVCRNPSVSELEGGWLCVAWDTLEGRVPRVGVRLLRILDEADGARRIVHQDGPDGQVSWLPGSKRGGGDLDPCVSPASGGGYVLAWTGNEGPTRDIFIQAFDRDGTARAGPLYVSVKHNEQDYSELVRLEDGRHVVIWEDDISGRDHLHARVFNSETGELGPRVTVNQRQTAFVADRTAPTAAALGGGFVAAWSDRRRSLGHDVYARVLGPGFDGP